MIKFISITSLPGLFWSLDNLSRCSRPPSINNNTSYFSKLCYGSLPDVFLFWGCMLCWETGNGRLFYSQGLLIHRKGFFPIFIVLPHSFVFVDEA
ncbi:hypothetical protein DL96DRAFT_367153 [Flagelloscypha sp. PMI_526]|nr:hypothetical protein DL96DRAFT_367153 [Flagelloscypha sp. PMI_526]